MQSPHRRSEPPCRTAPIVLAFSGGLDTSFCVPGSPRARPAGGHRHRRHRRHRRGGRRGPGARASRRSAPSSTTLVDGRGASSSTGAALPDHRQRAPRPALSALRRRRAGACRRRRWRDVARELGSRHGRPRLDRRRQRPGALRGGAAHARARGWRSSRRCATRPSRGRAGGVPGGARPAGAAVRRRLLDQPRPVGRDHRRPGDARLERAASRGGLGAHARRLRRAARRRRAHASASTRGVPRRASTASALDAGRADRARSRPPAAPYGIGRGIHLGDTMLGIKGRVAFEAPAAEVLLTAHRELEKLVLTGRQQRVKDLVAALYGDFVHEGQHARPGVPRHRGAARLARRQRVTGEVHVLLPPGRAVRRGRRLALLADGRLRGVYGEAAGEWTAADAPRLLAHRRAARACCTRRPPAARSRQLHEDRRRSTRSPRSPAPAPEARGARSADDIPCEEGVVVAVRVLNDKTTYNQLELPSGRMAQVKKGDIVAGALGHRKALFGYSGHLPEPLAPGDSLHLLNIGGVIGVCDSINPDLGKPFDCEVLGAVLHFPYLGERIGVPARIGERAAADSQPPLDTHGVPVVALVGTCMNAGKTAAACAIVRALRPPRPARWTRFKATGVSLRRDILAMEDAGARTTADLHRLRRRHDHGRTAPARARARCSPGSPPSKPDVDRLRARRRPARRLRRRRDPRDAEHPRRAFTAVVLSANDPVAAWGGVKLLRERLRHRAGGGHRPGHRQRRSASTLIEEQLGVPAINALTDAARARPTRVRARLASAPPATVAGAAEAHERDAHDSRRRPRRHRLRRRRAAAPARRPPAAARSPPCVSDEPGRRAGRGAFPHLAAAFAGLRFVAPADAAERFAAAARAGRALLRRAARRRRARCVDARCSPRAERAGAAAARGRPLGRLPLRRRRGLRGRLRPPARRARRCSPQFVCAVPEHLAGDARRARGPPRLLRHRGAAGRRCRCSQLGLVEPRALRVGVTGSTGAGRTPIATHPPPGAAQQPVRLQRRSPTATSPRCAALAARPPAARPELDFVPHSGPVRARHPRDLRPARAAAAAAELRAALARLLRRQRRSSRARRRAAAAHRTWSARNRCRLGVAARGRDRRRAGRRSTTWSRAPPAARVQWMNRLLGLRRDRGPDAAGSAGCKGGHDDATPTTLGAELGAAAAGLSALPRAGRAARACWLDDPRRPRALDFYGGHAVALLGYGHPGCWRRWRRRRETLFFQSNAVPLAVRARAARALVGVRARRGSTACSSSTAAPRPTRTRCASPSGAPAARGWSRSKARFHGRTAAAAAVTWRRARAGTASRDAVRRRRSCRATTRGAGRGAVDDGRGGGHRRAGAGRGRRAATSAATSCSRRARLTAQAGALLIFDEVQCGMGRTARPFAAQALRRHARHADHGQGARRRLPVRRRADDARGSPRA